MTKTKRQLRAEAVERLRELRAGTFNYMDLAASVAGIDGYACADTFALALIDLLTDDERVMTNLEWLYRENKTFHVVCMAFAEGYIDMMTPREEWLLSPHVDDEEMQSDFVNCGNPYRKGQAVLDAGIITSMDANGTADRTCPDAIGQSSNHSKAQSKDAPTLSGLYGVLSDDCGQNADMSQKDGDCVREGWEMSNCGTAEAETSQLPESDTREKLEAEIDGTIGDALRNLRKAIYDCVEQGMDVLSFSDGEFIDFEHDEYVGEYVGRAMEAIDRQEAITERELQAQVDDYRAEWHRACAERAELRRDLTAEKNKGIELAEQLGKAMAERDSYRAKVGAMLDAAQEIRRLGDIE